MIRTVKTKYGTLEGVTSNGGFALFRGIPYAKPPVGELRWRAPEEPEPWEGVRVCDTYGDACMQYDRWGTATDDVVDDSGHPYILMPNYPYPPKMSEDCLYLNIYTPAESAEDRLPVLFYIHGGGCQQWYGSDYEYCGDGFCRHGCILVTINYRLNVFGYYVHPELAAESGHDASGNYGLMDQIAALKWVCENIAGFGGDPDNITCFGQSSGGMSTRAALCSPLAENYIRRASIQSAGGLGMFSLDKTRAEMEEKGIRFMESTGCSSIAEMRRLTADELRIANDRLGGLGAGFNIYTDGYVLPESIEECIKGGRIRDVEIITGCTADEGANDKPPMFGSPMPAAIGRFAEAQRKNGKKPVYMYVFDREQPGDDVGVPHSCDNRYQFGSLDGSWRPYEECDWQLSEKMQRYWSNFAKTGDPNRDGTDKDAGLPVWTPADGTGRMMRLSVEDMGMRAYKVN